LAVYAIPDADSLLAESSYPAALAGWLGCQNGEA
jgi:hypothetical protein